jgi:hypothetical protein
MKKNTFFKSRGFSIKPVVLNIGLDFSWDQIPHRLPFFNQPSHLGGRNVEKRNFSKIDSVAGVVNPGFLSGGMPKVRDQGLRER